MRFKLHIGSVMGSIARLLIFPLLSLCMPAIAQSYSGADASEIEQLKAASQALQRRVQQTKQLAWAVNCYPGQDHPDVTQAASCGAAPIQEGLYLAPIFPAPDGKLHTFDTYAVWNTTPKLTMPLSVNRRMLHPEDLPPYRMSLEEPLMRNIS